jgi:hypothetical protein
MNPDFFLLLLAMAAIMGPLLLAWLIVSWSERPRRKRRGQHLG